MEALLDNYIRTERMRSGLSAREAGTILGYGHGVPVSRHERSKHIPPLLIAFGYAQLYKKSLPDLFPGLHEAVAKTIEGRIAAFEVNLLQQKAHGKRAAVIARKLEWLAARRTSGHK